MEYQERKSPRLKGYDYSEIGIYFITICTRDKMKIFGEIIVNDEGAENRLSKFGEIAKREIEGLKERYKGLIIDNFAVMPNHVHILLSNYEMEKRESIPNIICAYKSRTTFFCKKNGFSGERLFQRSYYDHIVRDMKGYEEIYRYIEENPIRWNRDMYF